MSEVERAGERLLLTFFQLLDDGHVEELTALFLPGGVWRRAGKLLQGQAQILAAMRERSATMIVRHVVTNLIVNATGQTTAEARLYLTAYRHDGGTKPAAVPVLRGPFAQLDVAAQLKRTAEGWRVASLLMERIFDFA